MADSPATFDTLLSQAIGFTRRATMPRPLT